MNRKAFFDALRGGALFPHGLTAEQVKGCEALLDSFMRNKIANPHHAAHILAHVFHETGSYMLPIKETVYASHKDKNPSDAEVIRRLNAAFAKGQMTWVKTPYWRDGAFGRGPIQITHWANYDKIGKRLGVDLRRNPSLALDPNVGADIAVVGMSEGMFTGKKLSDYSFPTCLSAAPDKHPRRIVNGKDGTDSKIKSYHLAFYAALIAAAYALVAPQPPVSTPPVVVAPVAPAPAPTPPVAAPAPQHWLVSLFAAIFGGSK